MHTNMAFIAGIETMLMSLQARKRRNSGGAKAAEPELPMTPAERAAEARRREAARATAKSMWRALIGAGQGAPSSVDAAGDSQCYCPA